MGKALSARRTLVVLAIIMLVVVFPPQEAKDRFRTILVMFYYSSGVGWKTLRRRRSGNTIGFRHVADVLLEEGVFRCRVVHQWLRNRL